MSDQTIQNRLTETILKSLDETFENGQGIYLDKGTSLFETLQAVTAEEASRPLSSKGTSIAAHVEHTRFYLQVLGDYLKQKPLGKIDWEETWRKTKVSPKEWESLKDQLKEGHQRILAIIKGIDRWDGEHEIGGSIAVLMHTAYHIGAIRQILFVVKQP